MLNYPLVSQISLGNDTETAPMAEGFLLVGLYYDTYNRSYALLLDEMIYPIAVLKRIRIICIVCKTFLINVSIRGYILRTTFLVYRSI